MFSGDFAKLGAFGGVFDFETHICKLIADFISFSEVFLSPRFLSFFQQSLHLLFFRKIRGRAGEAFLYLYAQNINRVLKQGFQSRVVIAFGLVNVFNQFREFREGQRGVQVVAQRL